MAIPQLKDKRVLVTGAGSGIGLETALAFARQGARLLLVDVNAVGLLAAQKAVQQLGAECRSYPVDVASEDAMAQLAQTVRQEHGVLDVLVNNAGVAFIGSFLCTPLTQWRRTLDVNIKGVVHGCHFFLPQMLEAGGVRHVVNVASAAGLAPTVNMSAYAASKHAVVGLTESLSLELLNTSIGVSVVCPGVINTPIVHPSPSSVGANVRPDQLQRLGAFYQTKGAHPRVVGDAIVAAVQRGKGLVLVGPYASLVYHLRRLSRGLLRHALITDSKKIGWL